MDGDGEKREPINYKRWGRGDTRHTQLKEYLVVAAAAIFCTCCARIAAPLRPTRDTDRREGQRDSRTDVGVSPFFCLSLSLSMCAPLLSSVALCAWCALALAPRHLHLFKEGGGGGTDIFHACFSVAALDTLILSPFMPPSVPPLSLLPSELACRFSCSRIYHFPSSCDGGDASAGRPIDRARGRARRRMSTVSARAGGRALEDIYSV